MVSSPPAEDISPPTTHLGNTRVMLTFAGRAQGCCQSAPRDNYQTSVYPPTNSHDESSSRAIASDLSHRPGDSHIHVSSTQGAIVPHRSRSRRRLAPGEHFNAPIRPHVWTSHRQWTRSELDRERREFFETRVTGRPEIWASLKAVVDLLGEGDIPTAQGILDAAAITVPTGDLKNGAYDEAGNLYQMPEPVISDPQNLFMDPPKDLAGEAPTDASEDEAELERRREEKGKTVLKSADTLKVKARLSDRGGPDVIVAIGKEQPVRALARRIQEEANVRDGSLVWVWNTSLICLDRSTIRERYGSPTWVRF